MSTYFELKLKDMIEGRDEKATADRIRDHILSLLEFFNVIEINLMGVRLTPFIAGEVIAEVANELGALEFNERIKIKHAADKQMALIRVAMAARKISAWPKNKILED